MPETFTGRVFRMYVTLGISFASSRYSFTLLSWVFLGFGSAAFHATQTTWGEFWDEFGMVIAIASTAFALFDVHPLTTGRRGALFYGIFSLSILFFSLAYLHLMYHPFFAVCFITSVLVVILLVATMPVLVNKGAVKAYVEETPGNVNMLNRGAVGFSVRVPLLQAIRLSVALALSGYGIWHIDQACVHGKWAVAPDGLYEYHWWMWSHPLWHLLTAAGQFFLLHSVIQCRVDTARSGLKRRPETGSFIVRTNSVKEALLVSLWQKSKKLY